MNWTLVIALALILTNIGVLISLLQTKKKLVRLHDTLMRTPQMAAYDHGIYDNSIFLLGVIDQLTQKYGNSEAVIQGVAYQLKQNVFELGHKHPDFRD